VSDPGEGDIWRYPYLWRWQSDRGETEGRKDRPTAIIAATRDAEDQKHLFLLPLTTKAPSPDRISLEVPSIEARRAGLTETDQVWVILDEYNYDVIETSFYFDPEGRVGRFSAAFSKKLLAAYSVALASQQTRRVSRRGD
jgi:hypothetical protein